MIESGRYDLGALVGEAGLRCLRCGSGDCAKEHAVRRRKRVTDLQRGMVHEDLPIVRVVFCSGTTASLTPAALWRGRTTVHSVLEAVARAQRDGIAPALGWTGAAWEGEEAVSERTLRRWGHLVRTRLVGGSLSWLGPRLEIQWSAARPEAPQLLDLLDRLDPALLLGFRCRFGRAVLDCVPSSARRSRSAARRVPGRLAEAPPPDPPTHLLPRGQRSGPGGRSPPVSNPTEGGDP